MPGWTWPKTRPATGTLPRNAASFIIEEGYMHTGKQYKIHLVAVSDLNIPSNVPMKGILKF